MIRAATARIGLGLLTLTIAWAGGGAHDAFARRQRVEAGAAVYRVLAHQRHARVIVAVDTARAAGRVLGRLPRARVAPTARWQRVPAFAARIDRAGLAALLRSPWVVRVDLDARGHGELVESAALIHADQAFAAGASGEGVTVAVLDSGVDTDNPDLADDIVAQHCFVAKQDGSGGCPNGQKQQDGPGSAEDDEGHGTEVTGDITSNGTVA